VLLAGVSVRDPDGPLAFEVLEGGIAFSDERIDILPGTRISLRGLPLRIEGSDVSGVGFALTVTNDDLDVNDALMDAIAAFVPEIAAVPRVAARGGHGRLRVVLSGEKALDDVRATLGLVDAVLVPESWTDTRFERVNCSIEADLRARRVTVETAGEGSVVSPRVTATGAGVPAGRSSRFLTPYFTTKAPGHGTALALSLSY